MKSFLSRIPLFVIILVGLDLAMVFLFILNKGLGSPSIWISNFVDLGMEANLPTWYSSSQLLLVAVLLTISVKATFKKANPVSWMWLLLTLGFYFLSLDEVAQIHECLGDMSDQLLPEKSRTNTPVAYTGLWIFVVGTPAFLIMIAIFFYLKRHMPKQGAVIRKFIIGLMIYFASAIGLEALANLNLQGKAFLLQMCGEEFGEMFAVTVLAWAAYDLMASYNISLVVGPSNTDLPNSD